MTNIIDFTGKTFIISGAGGIGAETARLLHSFGAKIILLDIKEENIVKTLSELSGEGHGNYVCDFSDVESIELVIKNIVKDHGPMDGFIHCVGIGAVRPLKMSKYDFMLKVMNINYFSFVEIVRCLSIKGNFNSKGMNVVGISALGAFLGNSTKTAYCASKGAMNAAVRCIAKELASKKIRVNTVAPGVTDTPMASIAEDYGSDSEEHKAILQRQYMGICQPRDIANTVAFLMSDMSKMISGSCIAVDGGKLSS